MKLVGKASFAELPEVSWKNMEVGEIYATAEIRTTDDGDHYTHTDLCMCLMDGIPGQIKAQKQVRFLKEVRTKLYSQIPGVYFFGPAKLEAQ